MTDGTGKSKDFARSEVRDPPPGETEPKSRATLPPPELSAPVRSIRRPASPAAEVVERRVGPKAEEAAHRARLAWARQGQDPVEIRAGCIALARYLGSKERDLREAAQLAREALASREDPDLRREAAHWIETLGDSAGAADFMEAGEPDASAWTRIGVLRARAGQAADAARAFENAAHLDPTDAMSLELRATLAWSSDVLGPSDAAASYIEAAGRRREAGALNGEMEDLLRAVEADPTSETAATALAAALAERGRQAAGEEVLRAQAEAQGGSARIGTHLRRFEAALTAGDVLRALDAGLAADLDAPPDAAATVEAALGTGFDEVLLRVGLFELLAARLEVAAERAEGSAKARVLEQVARLCAGPLSAPSRAARAHVQVLAADPSREDSVLALRAYATATRDMVPLVEGLVRGSAAAGEVSGRLRCARLLSQIAEEQIQSTKLARWALGIVTELAPEDVGAAAGLRRLGSEDDDGWRSTLVQELGGPRASGGLGRFLLGLDLVPPDEVEARAALAAAARAKRDLVGAREIVRPLVEHDQPTLRGLGVAWVNARNSGDARLVARAMIRTADFCTQAVQAVVLCEAADRLFRAGDPTLARKTAERACQADPAAPRPVATLANIVVGASDRTAASGLQRAAAMVFARGTWCEALANALEALGETDQCVAWTQRLVAIRPGDRSRTRLLLSRVQKAGDAARVADTLDWAMPQPQAAEHLAEIAAEGLSALVELDANRACILARRALDTFGPTVPTLHSVIVDIAGRSGDHVLAAVVAERLAELKPELPSVWLRVAQHRGALGDLDSEARALLRAVRVGAKVSDLGERIAALDKVRTGDGEIARLELSAELAAARGDMPAANRTWREVGGALWDLADDRDGALAAWAKGARLVRGGFGTMGADLVRFGGAQYALARLTTLLEEEQDPLAAGSIAAEAARVALPLGEPARAFDLASLALVKSPLLTGALEVAEKGAVASGRASEMTRLYDAVGLRSLGRFGRRAAHYRGARFFEHRGEHDLALRHASQAFLAVPSEGATMVLLRRIAEKANDLPTAVRTIVEVAQVSKQKQRSAWLVRAAALAGTDADSARLRVDVLLQAALLEPRTTTLDMLGDAARTLLSVSPDDHDTLQLRFGRAAGQLTARLEGPDGARVALSFVDLSLSLFEDADGALAALRHALDADADLEEYALLVPKAGLLATAEKARAVLEEQAAQLAKPYSNVGVFALRMLGSMAKHHGDADLCARFLMRAAEREPDDEALLREADIAARATPRGPEHERFEKKVPRQRLAEAWRAFGDAERNEGRNENAANAYERVIDLLPPGERDDVEKALREVFEAAGRVEELERRALQEASNAAASPQHRADRWDDVARVREERGDVNGACEALAEAAVLDGGPLERWSALERVATLAGRSDLRVRALREIELRVKDDVRPAVLRRMAIAYEELGDLDAVEGVWQRVLEIAPDDEQADQEIESVIARRGDYERLADHLARRAKRYANVSEHREKLRVVRLRRVAILEQRLGRANDACAELEQLTKEWPDNESALRYLADLYERTGAHAKAAPVWKHLASLARDETTRIDLELRAALSARTAGEGIRAAEWTREILKTSPGNVDALSLLAELARASSDDRTLGDALAGLAASPLEEPVRRSGWLIEAAQAAARVGDARSALERAQLAAKIAPERAETQLFARGLEYRLRGPGSLDDAKATVTELSKVDGPAVGDDAALLAFLWAEAVDVVEGVGAGLQVLEQARDRIGDHALVSLAIAERLLAKQAFDDAMKHLQFAVNGNLLGLRSRGRVAMSGADAAMRAGVQTIALRMLEIAARDPDTASEANEKLQALEAEMEARSRGEVPTAGIPSPGPIPLSRAHTPPPLPARAISKPAMPAVKISPKPPPPEPSSPDQLRSMREALAAGNVDAGDELVEALGDAPEHVAEVVRIRRMQVDLRPADPRLLAELRLAALGDRNTTFARAIDHVARAFDIGAGPVAPPSILAQVEHPGILGMLVKPAMGAAGEALAHVWEGAGSTLARDPGSYAISGVERVVPGPASVIARLYDSAIRLLDTPNIPLYVRRGAAPAEPGSSEPRLSTGVGMPKPGVALLATPSALLTGEVKEESPGVCWALGQALAGALPQSALLFGLPNAQSRAVWAAVLASFGPTSAGRVTAPESARWTTIFWSTIPGRLQRRIQELLGRDPPDYDLLLENALQSARRVALYLSGDIRTAIRITCHEPRIARQVPQSTAELQALCAEVPVIADLVRLAVRPEYADARWRIAPEGSGRVTLSSGRYRVM